MKKLVLFVALAAVFVLSFVSCSGSKSEDTSAENGNVESGVQEPGGSNADVLQQ
ncbi:hypothetical protein AGMMS49573_06960 [Endomicrobiia bacterium]|uniref:hypothetical protein n=1 Tax=Endomicrobium trichonymphae TaxID=1408204 RepID=UPI0003250E31|nr:hypothetical protein [Candidatus Endomicrobium trichonymphae]GHT05238.1 hypothetical protein AGMMS49523_04240 [Endomicrobiia bacterium]GHT13876.1 hypothetical protein AGMMS49571_08420 [Endomicrobiia bacterium]GHT16670.1 hypothetical protein AGMMS49573_06960 [Endomicrobiia bacterium]GHT19371.1 hypothetical protein AGMMS49929_02950 [Endomicrobiia bacterium]GHT22104.1 hypothetical protein AGMMS49953_00360 [Endomicrobiia bacterium]